MELQLLDYLYTVLHLLVIGFNMLGWIWQKTLKLHFITIMLTAVSWFGLGLWFGWGYCFLTDWQWEVKRKLGETNLPDSFIEYAAESLANHDISSQLVSICTAGIFFAVAVISIYKMFYANKQ